MFFYDILKRFVKSKYKKEYVDALTGLPNARGCLIFMNRLMRKGTISQYSALHFNLERFGMINRRFGMNETDNILVRYAMKVAEFFAEDEYIGRLGGDNFVAVVRKERTDALLDYLSGVNVYGMINGNAERLCIGAVAGIEELDESMQDGTVIISDCTMAMNEARHIQRKPYMYVSKELKDAVLTRKMMIAAFPKAMQNEEFKAFFQPKVCIDNYMIVGAEALVKWQQDGRTISPGEFIPVFEQNGMICMLDFYILEQVCKEIRQWIRMGMEPVRVSVNFSRKHLSNPNLAEDIIAVINKYEIDEKYIEIELTETVDEEESGLLVAFMEKMRVHNIRMAIDDFGTGYASLNMLRTFPVDGLKIDKSLVDNMEETDQIILSNVVKMATELKMDVVAEGVETWEQVNYLRKINCEIVQGFLFDKPLSKEEFVEKMQNRKYEIK